MSDTQGMNKSSAGATNATAHAEAAQPGAVNAGAQAQAPSVGASSSVAQAAPQVQSATTQNAAANNANVAFKAEAIGNRENARTKDYFATQNQETQAKKQEQSVRVRKTLIVGGGIVGALAIGGLVWLLVIIFSQPKNTATTSPEEVKDITEMAYDEAIEKAGINNPEVEVGDAEEDLSAADDVFGQAIKDARASEDDALVSGLQERQKMTLL